MRDVCKTAEVAGFARRLLSFFTVVAKNRSPRNQVQPSAHHDVATPTCAKQCSTKRKDSARQFAALRIAAPPDRSPWSNAAAKVMCKD